MSYTIFTHVKYINCKVYQNYIAFISNIYMIYIQKSILTKIMNVSHIHILSIIS